MYLIILACGIVNDFLMEISFSEIKKKLNIWLQNVIIGIKKIRIFHICLNFQVDWVLFDLCCYHKTIMSVWHFFYLNKGYYVFMLWYMYVRVLLNPLQIFSTFLCFRFSRSKFHFRASFLNVRVFSDGQHLH